MATRKDSRMYDHISSGLITTRAKRENKSETLTSATKEKEQSVKKRASFVDKMSLNIS